MDFTKAAVTRHLFMAVLAATERNVPSQVQIVVWQTINYTVVPTILILLGLAEATFKHHLIDDALNIKKHIHCTHMEKMHHILIENFPQLTAMIYMRNRN